MFVHRIGRSVLASAVLAVLAVIAVETAAQEQQMAADPAAAATSSQPNQSDFDFVTRLAALLTPAERVRLGESRAGATVLAADAAFVFADRAIKISSDALEAAGQDALASRMRAVERVHDRATASSARAVVRRVRAELYVERVTFQVGAGTSARTSVDKTLELLGLVLRYEGTLRASDGAGRVTASARIAETMIAVIDAALRSGAPRVAIVTPSVECARISKIEAITLKQKVVESPR